MDRGVLSGWGRAECSLEEGQDVPLEGEGFAFRM